jgi:hypothetical protein
VATEHLFPQGYTKQTQKKINSHSLIFQKFEFRRLEEICLKTRLKVAFQDGIITQVSADIRHIVGACASERIFACFWQHSEIIVFIVCRSCA